MTTMRKTGEAAMRVRWAGLMAIPLFAALVHAQTERWVLSEADSFRSGLGVDTTNVSIVSGDGDDGSVILAPASENFALHRTATDNDDNPNNNPANVLDGNIATFWTSYTVNDVGVSLTIDLQAVRTIERVNILGSVVAPRDKRIKGYIIEVSLDGNTWVKVAENPDNPNPDVYETFEAITARYVRVTITKNDRVNWTFIGEIEVYGSGYASSGQYVSPIRDFGRPVNFGKAYWDADVPEGTELLFQFRSDSGTVTDDFVTMAPDTTWLSARGLIPLTEVVTDSAGQFQYERFADYVIDYEQGYILRQPGGRLAPGMRLRVRYRLWTEWSEPYGTQGVFFRVAEPRQLLQFRVFLSTSSLETPRLRSVTIEYSASPVASVARVSVLPPEVPILKETSLVYRVVLGMQPTDLGIDTLKVETPSAAFVKRVQLGERSVNYQDLSSKQLIRLVFDPPIGPSMLRGPQDTLDVYFTSTLFLSENSFPGQIVSVRTPDNPQWLEQGPEQGWTVRTVGIPESPLVSVEAKPNPFSPDGDGLFDRTTIRFFVSKTAAPRNISVRIYSLHGDLVRSLYAAYGPSDLYEIQWDGRDENGQLVRPGLYLYQVKIEADIGPKVVTKTLAVTY